MNRFSTHKMFVFFILSCLPVCLFWLVEYFEIYLISLITPELIEKVVGDFGFDHVSEKWTTFDDSIKRFYRLVTARLNYLMVILNPNVLVSDHFPQIAHGWTGGGKVISTFQFNVMSDSLTQVYPDSFFPAVVLALSWLVVAGSYWCGQHIYFNELAIVNVVVGIYTWFTHCTNTHEHNNMAMLPINIRTNDRQFREQLVELVVNSCCIVVSLQEVDEKHASPLCKSLKKNGYQALWTRKGTYAFGNLMAVKTEKKLQIQGKTLEDHSLIQWVDFDRVCYVGAHLQLFGKVKKTRRELMDEIYGTIGTNVNVYLFGDLNFYDSQNIEFLTKKADEWRQLAYKDDMKIAVANGFTGLACGGVIERSHLDHVIAPATFEIETEVLNETVLISVGKTNPFGIPGSSFLWVFSHCEKLVEIGAVSPYLLYFTKAFAFLVEKEGLYALLFESRA